MLPETILIVDDAPSIRAALRTALEHAGLRVVEAEDGRRALEQARQHLPDAVLLDLRMPVLDGWQTARVLRADVRTASIPVIAITGLDEVQADELERAGFCAHLRKPFTLPQVVTAIRAAVARCGPASDHRPPDRGTLAPPRAA